MKVESLVAASRRMARAILLVLLLGALAGLTACGGSLSDNVLTDHLAEPLNGATTAVVDLDAGDGNLTFTWVHLVASVFLCVGVMILIGAEEKQLTQAFGKEYRDYMARVDRLVPFKRP